MLVHNYDPSSAARGLTLLESILDFKFNASRWLADFQAWRLLVSRYEMRMGKQIDRDIKCSIILKGLPASIRTQLKLDVERHKYSYEELSHHAT